MGASPESRPILYSQIYLVITALGFGGVVATLSVAVQNAVPFRDVGVATAALQFCRSLGGMMGLATTGVVMVQSFRSGMEAVVPDNVSADLPEGLLDSVKEDPRAVLDPSTAQALKETLAETGDVSLADSLLNSLNLSLTGALSGVFTVLWVAVALSFAVALFLRVRHRMHWRYTMRNAIEWFARNSVAANLLMVLILGGGILLAIPHSHGSLPRDIHRDMINVSMIYLGAAPEEVEEAICIRIEEAVARSRRH